jgi:tRNA nucleotidyltransferase (CCA-adding enzyme)
MEKFRPPGTHSSSPCISREDVARRLSDFCAQGAVRRLEAALAGAEFYLVGGLVRDAFLSSASIDELATDIDVATNLDATDTVARCAAHGIKVIETGLEHGTVLAVVDDTHIEVTTFRVPCHRTSHTTARDITTDLSGRDFTINAIAFDAIAKKIIDPYTGVEDLEAGIVRAVDSAEERFREDPLRVLRLVRFGPAQGRSVEATTQQAASACVQLLQGVSVERIKSELDKIILSSHPGSALRALKELRALPLTIPELIPSIGFEQNKFHIHDVFEHTVWVLDRTPLDLTLRWAAIFHDIGKPHTLSVDEDGARHFYQHEMVSERLSVERMKALRFSHHDTHEIGLIVRHHMRPLDCGAPGVRRIMRDLGLSFEKWRLFKNADSSPTMPEAEFATTAQAFDELAQSERDRLAGPSYGKLAVTGEDLIALGMKPGPAMGVLLKELEEIVLDDPSRNLRESLIEEAKQRLAVRPR